MKLERIIYTIRKIEKSVGLDSRLDDRMLIDMVNRYRVVVMGMYLQENRRLKQSWFQSLGVVTPVMVNSADDVLISYTSVSFGKYTLPKFVEFQHQKTLIIRSASKHKRIEEIDINLIFKMIETNDEMLLDFIVMFREDNIIYIYNGEKINVRLILENPLEGITYDALILPDGTISSPQGTKRNLTMLDEYPADGATISALIIEILIKELGIERSSIPDITVDSAESDDLVKSKV